MNSTTRVSFQIYSQLRYNRYMNSLSDLFPEDLYHSYIVEGDPVITAPLLRDFLEGRSDIGKDNPDILCQSYDSFTINDTARIKDWHTNRGVTDRKRVCIIGTKFINHEAEQSLLKIIEEPNVGTHLFIIVPNASLLLDTIRSRTHLVKIENKTESPFEKVASVFISATKAGRLEIVADLIESNKNNENSGGLRFQATELLNEIEKVVYLKFKENKDDEHTQFILEELQKNRLYLSTPGASVKMILEHIALVL